MSKRRGKRIVVGYVVSHTGKRGGPWEAAWGPLGTRATSTNTMIRYSDAYDAEDDAEAVRMHHPHARALPLVRYEVDAEEERLRDAVVEAALAHDGWQSLNGAVRALRAHREKVGR